MTKLKPYPKYKDFGIEWIGDVPEGWNVCKLNLFGRLKGGFAFKATDFTYEGIPVVRMNNLKRGTLDFSNAAFVPQSVAPQEFCLNTGDILWGMSGSIGETGSLGNFARVREDDLPALLNQRVGKFVLNQKRLNSFFWEYYIQTNAFYEQIIIFSTGTAQFNVSSEQVESCSISLPPLSEQQAIAAYLDRETAQIDALIAKKARSIELLREKRQAMITHAVTKGLNPNAKMKDSGIEWIGEVPEGWAVKKLKLFTKVKDGTHETPEYVDETHDSIPLVTSKDIVNGEISFENTKFISKRDFLKINIRSNVSKYDVIMPMIGTIGNPAIVYTDREFSIKNVALFKTDDLLDAKFLQFFLTSGCIKAQFEHVNRGGVQQFVSLDILNNVYIVVPSDIEPLVSHIEQYALKIDNLIAKIERSIELLKEKRQALITAAVTGKIDVREAAPEAVCC